MDLSFCNQKNPRNTHEKLMHSSQTLSQHPHKFYFSYVKASIKDWLICFHKLAWWQRKVSNFVLWPMSYSGFTSMYELTHILIQCLRAKETRMMTPGEMLLRATRQKNTHTLHGKSKKLYPPRL